MIYLSQEFVNCQGGVKIKIREWVFRSDPDGVFIAPIIPEGTAKDVLLKISKYGSPAEFPIYEEKDGSFVKLYGVKVGKPFETKASVTWLLTNKEKGIDPIVLGMKKKTAMEFYVMGFTCCDVLFAQDIPDSRLKYRNADLGIYLFEISQPTGLATLKRDIIAWREKKYIVNESIHIAVFKNKENLEIKTTGINEFYTNFLVSNGFVYDRKRRVWTGQDEESVRKLVLLDSIPSAKTYGKGLYFLCETEKDRMCPDYRNTEPWEAFYSA